jgi:hypothetical protein
VSIRRRNDSVKPGMGIDGTQGEKFTKSGLTAPDSMTYTYENGPERNYDPLAKPRPGDQWAEVGMDQSLGRRNQRDFQWRSEVRDIFNDVQANDGDQGGASAPIRYGVNRSQGSKR